MIDDPTVDAAVAAVRAAGTLTAMAQGRLLDGQTLAKRDASPVTVADFGAQAVVCSILRSRLGDVAIVGEESASDLADRPALLTGTTELVSATLGRPVSAAELVDWIGLGAASATGRYWTLDPIDGTKGFLRGDQYAIALALIDDGEVVLGVLGCPRLDSATGAGVLFVAAGGTTEAYSGDDPTPRPVTVADPPSLAQARFCESVESGHSDHDQSSEIAARLGISTAPYRIDSQCKYGVLARGDASIYLRLPTRSEYEEKIWDHAAGALVVEFAGGTVTDIDGAPLDFSHGATLCRNRGVVATSGAFHDEVVASVRAVLG
ncbi:MAG: 3'(2'),5'-bisphosphate nucleotidase [Ilumatobacteraceae bacterium]